MACNKVGVSLAGRAYGLVVHGDVAGVEAQRRALADWRDWMGLVDAGASSRLDRYIGYYKPYATSHAELDADQAVQEDVRNVAHVFLSDPHRLVTFGGLALSPAKVESPYIIRVAIALLMVAASIKGRSEITNALPIRRAHPNFVENLCSVGASVEWTGGE